MLGFNELVISTCTKKMYHPNSQTNIYSYNISFKGDPVFVFYEFLPPSGNKEELFASNKSNV